MKPQCMAGDISSLRNTVYTILLALVFLAKDGGRERGRKREGEGDTKVVWIKRK